MGTQRFVLSKELRVYGLNDGNVKKIIFFFLLQKRKKIAASVCAH